jgi:hypothetical protein
MALFSVNHIVRFPVEHFSLIRLPINILVMLTVVVNELEVIEYLSYYYFNESLRIEKNKRKDKIINTIKTKNNGKRIQG